MNSEMKLWAGLIAVAIIAIGGYFYPQVQNMLGATGTRFPYGLSTSSVSPNNGKLLVGSAGTNIGTIIYGTCNLLADSSIAASSTAMVDCQSSSFLAGDTVIIAGNATTSTAMTRQFAIHGTGSASSTAGYAPVRVTNWTGAAVTPASLNGFGSSTPFVIIRP